MSIPTPSSSTPSSAEGRKYYEERWQSEPVANLWAMARAAEILREVAKVGLKTPRCLDMGCGTGWLTAILSQFGEACGVDLAPAAARSFHPELSFFNVGDAIPGKFDIVVSQEVLEHVEDQQGYIDLIAQTLKPEGALVLTTPNAKVSLRDPQQFVTQPVEKHLTRKELQSLLESRFEVTRLRSFFFGYAHGIPYRIQMRFGERLDAGLHFIAVCRPRRLN